MYQRSSFGYALVADWKRHRVVIITVALASILFVLDMLLGTIFPRIQLKSVFWLMRKDLLENFAFFQPLTYSFFHADFLHLFFNMLIFWMMGRELEEKLGRLQFTVLLITLAFCGGMLHIIFSELPVIGASALVFGIMLLYAYFWPNREVLVFFIFPVKVKYLVMILAGVEFLLSMQSLARIGSGRISHWAHLGGLAGTLLWMVWYKRVELRHTVAKKSEKRKLEKHRIRVENRIKEKERVDLLLDKINENGMNSLTRSEKKFLDTASKKF